jgi:hypothetical protein
MLKPRDVALLLGLLSCQRPPTDAASDVELTKRQVRQAIEDLVEAAETLTYATCKADTYQCTVSGNCTLGLGIYGPACVPTAEGCASSLRCTRLGECSLGTDPFGQQVCEVATDEDCAKQASCRHEGKCYFDGKECIAGTAGACATSQDCVRIGKCGWDGGTDCSETAEGCAASLGCQRWGRCSVGTWGGCVRSDDPRAVP